MIFCKFLISPDLSNLVPCTKVEQRLREYLKFSALSLKALLSLYWCEEEFDSAWAAPGEILQQFGFSDAHNFQLLTSLNANPTSHQPFTFIFLIMPNK